MLRVANYITSNYKLKEFGGRDESNHFLIKLGFTIVLKDTNKSVSLVELTHPLTKNIDYFPSTLCHFKSSFLNTVVFLGYPK